MRRNIWGSVLIAAAALAGTHAVWADCIPDPVSFVERERLGRTNVTVTLPSGQAFRPEALTVRTDLGGEWKFRGLDRQHDPFGPFTEAERALLSPERNDADWTTIRVPLNWWADARFAYDKVYDPKQLFFRGYYRRTIRIANPKDGRRRILRFEEVGAEFDLFVNGRPVAHHLGDFTPFEADITDALVPGDNLIALRVLADFGPDWGKPFVRIYGAHWDYHCMKGGIWHTVALCETPTARLAEMLIDPAEDATSVHVRCRVENAGGERTLELLAALVEDVRGAAKPTVRPIRSVRLAQGTNEVVFDLPAKDAKRWTLNDPNLYYLVTVLADANGRPVAAGTDRFGFRTMRIDGRRFVLNGEPIYLMGDSIHSLSYGGRANDSGRPRFANWIRQHKRNGANLFRTAHMPAIPEIYDFADEIGMLVYDEWGNSFCNDIDEKPFEANNLPELERWIRRDYNHASVVLWSLGNEVKHIGRADIVRQLDRQYDLVKALDGQHRPASTFSGGADVWAYGRERLKTDFLDTHRYLGMDTTSWTTWFVEKRNWMPRLAAVFGNQNGQLDRPLIMWECVGAGWGLHTDDAMRPGDVERYLAWARKPCTWAGGRDQGLAFSGAVGMMPILDRKRSRHYLQRYLADRLCELFVQDPDLTGFAPWFADVQVPGATRWFQPVYPLLRNNAADTGRLMYRQLTSPGQVDVECAVVNHTAKTVRNTQVRVWLGNRKLADVPIGDVLAMDERTTGIRLEIPSGYSGRGEIRLELVGGDGVTGRNGYAVTLHPAGESVRPIASAKETVLTHPSAATENLLRTLGVPFRVLDAGAPLPTSGAVVVPPGEVPTSDIALADFARRGGTVLVLEPSGLTVPGVPFLDVLTAPNHHVELVVPDHPAFAGLCQEDFDVWAENACGSVIERGFSPLDSSVLAAKGRYVRNSPYAAALCAYACGKGRFVLSGFAALAAFGRNPAATRYLSNLIGFVLSENGGVCGLEVPVFDDPLRRPVPTDLSADPLVIVSRDKPVRISFKGATNAASAPWKILFFRNQREKLAKGGYRYLTLTFTSRSRGLVDLTVPKDDHSERLSFTFPTSPSEGSPVTLRLDLAKDFRFANGTSFSLDKARGEIILYNGYEQRGLPRPSVSFEILELKFE